MYLLYDTLSTTLLPFNANTESKTPYTLTSSTHHSARFSSTSHGFIVTPIPTVTQGK